MSRFFSEKFNNLTPYVPGEQPKGGQNVIKLNTNESPFPPSSLAVKMAAAEGELLRLYPDPSCSSLVKEASVILGVDESELLFTNGSDDILNFAFMAFCDKNTPAVFPDITYGFYSVFAELNNVKYREIPLRKDFTIDVDAYCPAGGTVFIANPNAPTGIALSLRDIEKIIKSNPENVVVVDEAYVDFGGESAVSLIKKYSNLLVTRTFSKSRSLAGGRLGIGLACPDLINDLQTLRFSTNPYNINRMTMAAGIGALKDVEYFNKCLKEIISVRQESAECFKARDFIVLPSSANFLFVKYAGDKKISGRELYQKLKNRNILIRHFDRERLMDYNRVTIGTRQQMKALFEEIDNILKER